MEQIHQTPLLRLPWPGRADILVKDESRCPTGTFKDRLAWRLAEILKKDGADERLLITTITLGNTLVSLTAAFEEAFPRARRPQLLGIFPRGFSGRTIGPDNSGRTILGSDVLTWLHEHGSRWVEHPLDKGYITADDARKIARTSGLYFDDHRDVTNGIGVAAYEIILEEALIQGAGVPDCVIVPVGAGVLFDEFVDFVERAGSRTRVLGVTTVDESSIADKIYGRYSPYFEALRSERMARHPIYPRHKVLVLDDELIRLAINHLPPSLHAEPSAAAAFVPLGMPEEIAAGELVLVINTGNGIVSAHAALQSRP